jgi:hypothetical protein
MIGCPRLRLAERRDPDLCDIVAVIDDKGHRVHQPLRLGDGLLARCGGARCC